MTTVFVCLDGSPPGQDAAAWAEALAASTGADLIADEAERLGSLASPPDLVVVGAAAGQWYPALHLDQPAHALVARAGWPLAVVPGGAPPGVRHLVVGVDGTPASLDALAWAAGLAAALGADLTLVHARPTRPSRDAARDRGGGQAEGLSAWAAPVLARGGRPELREAEGDPVGPLRRAGAERPRSVIVLGGRPVDGAHHHAIGSVGLRILDHLVVPVVVVPPGTRAGLPPPGREPAPRVGAE